MNLAEWVFLISILSLIGSVAVKGWNISQKAERLSFFMSLSVFILSTLSFGFALIAALDMQVGVDGFSFATRLIPFLGLFLTLSGLFTLIEGYFYLSRIPSSITNPRRAGEEATQSRL